MPQVRPAPTPRRGWALWLGLCWAWSLEWGWGSGAMAQMPDASVPRPAASASAAPHDLNAVPEAASGRSRREAVSFANRAVVSAHPEATRAGWRVMQAGGNAVDAAVATQFALAVVEPQSSGLGGGGFAVAFDGQTVWAFDGREAAPQAADADLLSSHGQPMGFEDARRSPRSVGVPALVPLLHTLHTRHGQRPWASLLAPAIALAEQGFAMTPRLHRLVQDDPLLRDDPQARLLFYEPGGQAKPVGSVLRNPELGWLLRRVAALGPRAMRQPAVTQALLARIGSGLAGGSPMTRRDLLDYRVRVGPALCFDWAYLQGARLCGAPPPSSGTVAVGQIVSLLEQATTPWRDLPLGPDWGHGYVEAARLAYADRAAHVGDPALVVAPPGGWGSLLQGDYLRQRAALLGPGRLPRASPGQPGGAPLAQGSMADQPEYGTTHLSVVDAQGRAVALTSSIESAFGARRMVNTGQGRVGGFLLNHELTDFALRPRDDQGRLVANAPGPSKRPRSSMTPLLVLQAAGPDARAPGQPPVHEAGSLAVSASGADRVRMVLGSAGGPMIIHHVAQSLWAMGRWGLTPQQAVDLPRFGLTDPAGPVWLERDSAVTDWADALRLYGHGVRVTDMTSGLHLLARGADGRWQAGVDPRREGLALGD